MTHTATSSILSSERSTIGPLSEPASDHGVESELGYTQRLVLQDTVRLLKNPSLDSMVSAVLDNINVSSPYTSRNELTAPGAMLVKSVLSGYLPDKLELLQSLVDEATRFGLISEEDMVRLTANPQAVSIPLRKILDSAAEKLCQPLPVEPTT